MRIIITIAIAIVITAGSFYAQSTRNRFPPPVKHSSFGEKKSLRAKLSSPGKIVNNGDTSSGIVWGPIIKLSPDDPWPSGGNYIPRLAVQGNTIHCVWESGQFRLPYIRSIDDGLTWEQPIGLLKDSVTFVSVGGSLFTSESNMLYVFFAGQDSGMSGGNGKVYYIKSSDRGESWSTHITATSDTMGAFWSPSARNDTLAVLFGPKVNQVVQWPRITRSTDAGVSWTKNPIDMPSSASNQLRVALTSGLLNLFHVGQRWFPNPEIVLQRSRDLANSWIDSLALSPVDGYGSDMPEVASYERFGTGDASERTTLGVMWRGEEFTGAGFSAGMALRLSYDNGKTWQPMQIVSDTPRGSFHSLAIKENLVAVSWQDELGDWGPFRVKARVSCDCGKTWYDAYNLTSEAAHAGDPSVAVSRTAVHVAWDELKEGKWNIYYRRGELRNIPLLSSTSITFDTVAVGCSRNEIVTVRNNRCDPLNLTALALDEQDFSIDPDDVIVQPRDSAMLTVRFYPMSAGDKSSLVVLFHNQAPSPDTIVLSAYAIGTGSEISITDSVVTGWRMISVPVESPCVTILPGSFLYQGSYQPTDTLLIGKGYWNKLSSPKLSFAGYAVNEETVAVQTGWNMIGSISSTVAVGNIQSIPGGTIVSDFYGYDGSSYVITDSIYPARSYWVKVNQDASLILSTSLTSRSLNSVRIIATDEMPPPPPDVEISNPIPTKSVRIPSEFELEQNYPNPFNPYTKIRFTINESRFTTLKVYDLFGREIVTLVNEKKNAGEYEIEWNAEHYASGAYYCRLTLQSEQGITKVSTKKLILIK